VARSGLPQKRLEFHDFGKGPRLVVPARQEIRCLHITASDGFLEITKGLIFCRFAIEVIRIHHLPDLGWSKASGREHLELQTAARTTHCRSPLGDQRIVKLVLRSAAPANYIHRFDPPTPPAASVPVTLHEVCVESE
jgi:hypothetical protein